LPSETPTCCRNKKEEQGKSPVPVTIEKIAGKNEKIFPKKRKFYSSPADKKYE